MKFLHIPTFPAEKKKAPGRRRQARPERLSTGANVMKQKNVSERATGLGSGGRGCHTVATSPTLNVSPGSGATEFDFRSMFTEHVEHMVREFRRVISIENERRAVILSIRSLLV